MDDSNSLSTCLYAAKATLIYLRQRLVTPQARKWIEVGAVILGLILTAARSASGSPNHDGVAEQGPLAELAALVQQSLTLSRPLLLGSRDPNGPSCVRVSHTGAIQGIMPKNPGDLDGGPGTSTEVLYFFDRKGITSPLQDFKWHQTRLRTYLENNIALGEGAAVLAHELAEKARMFLEAASSWSALPANITATGFNRRETWPSYCVSALDNAVRDQDLAAVQHWAHELAAATFWLEDMLRWRSFIFQNNLAALDFQARCESLFVAAEQEHLDYKPESTMSQFPAGVLMNGKRNYYEVERQAERLFSMPGDRVLEIAENKHLTPSSVWMPPASREAYLKLRAVLSPQNQQTWDLAARTPYEHSYLVSVLFRARTAELMDNFATVLKAFDIHNRQAKISELMGVLMDRGHSFAGIEWGDRFQPQLIQAAADINTSETDREALHDAWAWTNHFYQLPAEYGVSCTLREALEHKRLDCVRATDMMVAIFRNAGRTRIGNVRWCCETGGHSVAAYLGSDNAQTKPLLADGLVSSFEAETWPDCYFHGHAWPPGMQANKSPYAVELYVRGLDSYVWAQGFIVRGPNAGWLTETTVPYSMQFSTESTRKVYDGPYPE